MYTDRLYTGQRDIASLGLYFYNARFYDAYLNRFIQPDTIIPNQYDPQSLNRYAYAKNNPIRYNDPTGHCISGGVVDTIFCAWIGMMVVGAVIDAGINIHNQLEETGHVDINEVVEHAWQGAVIGGAPLVAAFAAPAVVGAAGETIASTGNSLGSNAISSAITNAGIKTMSASSSMSDWLWKASVTAVTGDPSLFTLPNKLTSGTLAIGSQKIDLQSGVGGAGSQMPNGASGFNIVTRTHVEGNAAALMQQNNWSTGTLFINNTPCTSCTKLLPGMLPVNSTLRIIGPSWYERIIEAK